MSIPEEFCCGAVQFYPCVVRLVGLGYFLLPSILLAWCLWPGSGGLGLIWIIMLLAHVQN